MFFFNPTMRPISLILGAYLLAGASGVFAANLDAGKAKSMACATCHGMNGLSVMPDAANLAGQSEIYLSAQLKNFRSGKRVHEVMGFIAKPLTDDDIANLSAWYSAMKVTVTMP